MGVGGWCGDISNSVTNNNKVKKKKQEIQNNIFGAVLTQLKCIWIYRGFYWNADSGSVDMGGRKGEGSRTEVLYI